MMPENASSVNVEKLFSTACELPYCKIDREEFLTKELKNRVSPLQLADALENELKSKVPEAALICRIQRTGDSQ